MHKTMVLYMEFGILAVAVNFILLGNCSPTPSSVSKASEEDDPGMVATLESIQSELIMYDIQTRLHALDGLIPQLERLEQNYTDFVESAGADSDDIEGKEKQILDFQKLYFKITEIYDRKRAQQTLFPQLHKNVWSSLQGFQKALRDAKTQSGDTVDVEAAVLVQPLIRPSVHLPVKFNTVHGNGASLTEGYTVASRTTSYYDGVVFSDRPIRRGENVTIRINELNTSWSSTLSYGFTTLNPNGLSRVPLSISVDSYETYNPSSLPLIFGENLWKRSNVPALTVGSVLQIYLDSDGNVRETLNGASKGSTFVIPSRALGSDLWLVLDIRGYVKSIRIGA